MFNSISDHSSRFRDDFKALGLASEMVANQRDIIVSLGDISRRLPCHSLRKPIANYLIGVCVDRKSHSLDDSLASMTIDDISPLSKHESECTLRHCLVQIEDGAPATLVVSDQEKRFLYRGKQL